MTDDGVASSQSPEPVLEVERTVAGWPLPRGRMLPVARRGRVFVREVEGPPQAPAVVLLHGLGATSGLQFFATMNQLASSFRVIAPDMRDGTGSSTPRKSFSLENVADDAAGVLDELGVKRAIVVGYSLGGFVARLLVKRRPDVVAGIVFAATVDQAPRWLWPKSLAGLNAVLTALPRPAGGILPQSWFSDDPASGFLRWFAGEVRKLEVPMMVGALDAVLRFRPDATVSETGLPVAFIVTTHDRLVPPAWQRSFAATFPGAPVYEVAAGHAASGLAAERFGPVVIEACRNVAARAGLR